MTDKTDVKEGELLPKRGRGRPRVKYKDWMPDKLVEIAKTGGHIAAMLVELDICKDTFNRWKREYPDFGEAAEKARVTSQAYYENVLLQGALGKIPGFNFNSVAMILNNKCPDEYRRSANAASTSINIGSINSIEKMDAKDLDKKIAQLTRKLGIESEDDE